VPLCGPRLASGPQISGRRLDACNPALTFCTHLHACGLRRAPGAAQKLHKVRSDVVRLSWCAARDLNPEPAD
jgi:hypothetical protein